MKLINWGYTYMWEEYYKPLPDADKYLKRIGVERREELTKEYLDKLVFCLWLARISREL